MNSSQRGILWIGVIIVLIFLFTDQNFRNSIFKRAAPAPAPFTTAQILTLPNNGGSAKLV